MVKTYHDRAEESTKRLELRSTAHSLTRIISEGTNCSPFEASIITEKARRFLGSEIIMRKRASTLDR